MARWGFDESTISRYSYSVDFEVSAFFRTSMEMAEIKKLFRQLCVNVFRSYDLFFASRVI